MDDYYGPGSEEHDQDMREEAHQELEKSQYEQRQYEWEKEQEQQMYEEMGTQDGMVEEDCHADYSGGKAPHKECDYYSEMSTSSSDVQPGVILGGTAIVLVTVSVIVLSIMYSNKNKK